VYEDPRLSVCSKAVLRSSSCTAHFTGHLFAWSPRLDPITVHGGSYTDDHTNNEPAASNRRHVNTHIMELDSILQIFFGISATLVAILAIWFAWHTTRGKSSFCTPQSQLSIFS
jgi:hypothetical protein